MMDISKKIKLFSTIGSRATFGTYLNDVIKYKSDLIVMSSDTSTSAGLDKFKKLNPNNYIEIGIAEQNLVGVAAGIASQGIDIITTTFSPFQTLRCCEQIKVNLGYMKEKVIMVGLASGISLGSLGFTHCSIEDIGILRSIPNITILSPADCFEVTKCIDAAINHNQSVYIRLTGESNCPIVYEEDYNFEIGKCIELKKGDDICLIATGSMVKTALDVTNDLKKDEISASVINVHTIKPIDESFLIENIKKYKFVVTLEEHNKYGGLGSAVSEIITSHSLNKKQLFVAINDSYEKAGGYEYLKKKYYLLREDILNKIKKEIS
jgi:transketolase